MNTNDKQRLSLIFKLEEMEQFLIENKCNSIFDYYEVDKDNLIIEME